MLLLIRTHSGSLGSEDISVGDSKKSGEEGARKRGKRACSYKTWIASLLDSDLAKCCARSYLGLDRGGRCTVELAIPSSFGSGETAVMQQNPLTQL